MYFEANKQQHASCRKFVKSLYKKKIKYKFQIVEDGILYVRKIKTPTFTFIINDVSLAIYNELRSIQTNERTRLEKNEKNYS